MKRDARVAVLGACCLLRALPARASPAGMLPAAASESAAAGVAGTFPAPPARPALAGEASERYERALRHYDEGAYDAALRELERAYDLAPTFRLLYNMAIVSLELRDYAAAMGYFERYVAAGQAAIPREVRLEIARSLEELAPRVARVEIVVDVEGAEVRVDDRIVGRSPLARELRLNAGARRIWAQLDGRLPDSRVVDLAGGDRARVALTLAAIPAPPSPDGVAPDVPWLGWAATGALGVGAVLSATQAVSAHTAYAQRRGELGVSRGELDQARSHVVRWSVATDVFAVSALALGGYCLYLSLQPGPSAATSAQLGWALRVLPTGAELSMGF